LAAIAWFASQKAGDQGSRPDLLTAVERTEVTQLRKELGELRRANGILKAASVFFAKELNQPRTRPTR
jgi:transposase